jgi:RNA polymerase sigma-70 factor (subfamily 1)
MTMTMDQQQTVDPALSQTLDLVRQAKAGSATALNALFGRYYERVRKVVRVRLGARLRGRLETGDILQETFLSALKSFDRFEVRDESEILHWLSAVAENQIRGAADHHGAQKRSLSREIRMDDGDDDRRPLEFTAGRTLPLEAAVRSERTALVERCLDGLSDGDREVIIQRDYMGASWEAIARETGRPSPDAARMKHAHAIVELARRMRRAEQA